MRVYLGRPVDVKASELAPGGLHEPRKVPAIVGVEACECAFAVNSLDIRCSCTSRHVIDRNCAVNGAQKAVLTAVRCSVPPNNEPAVGYSVDFGVDRIGRIKCGNCSICCPYEAMVGLQVVLPVARVLEVGVQIVRICLD